MNRYPKILLVAPYFHPHIGGMENYVLEIGRGLSCIYGWAITVITTHDLNYISKHTSDYLTVYRLPVWFTLSNTPINPLWFFHIKSIIRHEKPDLINAHSPVPFIADLAGLASSKIPFVLTYHYGSMIKPSSLWNPVIFVYEKFLLPKILAKTDLLISNSDFVRNGVLRKFKNKTVTINPGVDSVSAQPRKHFDGKTILFIAGLTKAQKYKGLQSLLLAMQTVKKHIKKSKLIIVGTGDAIKEYKKIVSSMGLTECTTFTGPLYGTKLKQMYRRAHLLVHPPLLESFGMVLIEAMAQGTPVVATNIGGIPDVITHNQEGLLVPPHQPQKLAEAIISVLTDVKLSSRMSLAGMKKVRFQYLWQDQIRKTKSAFAAILERNL